MITNNFRVDVTTGSLANRSFFGSFRYDDTALTDSSVQVSDPANGNQIINASNGLIDLSFNFLGNIYTQASDSDFPEFPQLNFQNGLFQGLDFFVFEDQFSSNSTVISGSFFAFGTSHNPTVGSFFAVRKGKLSTSDASFETVTYEVQPIQIPALLPSLIGLGIGVFRKRSRQNQNISPDTALWSIGTCSILSS